MGYRKLNKKKWWDELRLYEDRYLLHHLRNPHRDKNPRTRHSRESTQEISVQDIYFATPGIHQGIKSNELVTQGNPPKR